MWTFPYPGETKELNDATRASAPGSFVRLSDGYTHYELSNPSPLPAGDPFGDDKGPGARAPVVLVHGFSVPYFIWDPTFEFLTKSGFRVLRYDLFGRGYSDRPRVRYDIDLFCKQLKELLDILGFEREGINLTGLSMGGSITASFTERHPGRVRKLILVDPAGAKPVTLSTVLKTITTPGLGELALGLFGSGQMAKSVESDFYNPAHVKAFVRKYMVQMKYKGFMRAILSTMRNGALGDFSAVYRKIGEMGIPTLLLWGREDKAVPFEHSDDVRAAIPQVEFHVFEKCGHIPHYEKPGEANPILLEFLK
jgi:pimeloyl-ACP methyl ester carboxylesterase